jgi:ribosome-binding protein aMBF1 (putative translation factor)
VRKKLTQSSTSGYHRRTVTDTEKTKGRATSRTKIGDKFSEGSRRLWVEMTRRSWEQSDLAGYLDDPLSTVHKWLYGDSVPSLSSLEKIERKLGIDAMLFARKPTRPFELPAVAAA